MSVENGERFVSWRQFVAICLTVVVTPIVISWGLLQSHSNQLHRDAIGVREFTQLRNDIEALRQELQALREEILTRAYDE